MIFLKKKIPTPQFGHGPRLFRYFLVTPSRRGSFDFRICQSSSLFGISHKQILQYSIENALCCDVKNLNKLSRIVLYSDLNTSSWYITLFTMYVIVVGSDEYELLQQMRLWGNLTTILCFMKGFFTFKVIESTFLVSLILQEFRNQN